MNKRTMTSRSTALLASALVLACALPTAQATSPSTQTIGDEPISARATHTTNLGSFDKGIASGGYWTEEKMRNATPADVLAPPNSPKTSPESTQRTFSAHQKGEIYSHPTPPKTPAGPQIQSATVPATTGKLFFSKGGEDYVCSGAVVNTPNNSVVSTAGHCIHSGKDGDWHTNISFAPAYFDGPSHHGLWEANEIITFKGWADDSDFDYDQAFISVHPRDDRTIVEAVGANGIAYNYSHDQSDVRIWGWPAGDPYDGKRPFYCDGSTKKTDDSSNDMVMPCSMTGGSSGGPWLQEVLDENLGIVFGVTSRRSTTGEKRLFSTPYSDSIKKLLADVGE